MLTVPVIGFCVCVWPDEAIIRWDGLLEELELVEVEDNEVSSAKDGHQDAHAAEDESVEGAAEGPPGAQEQEDEEVDSRGHRGQHDTCKHKNSGYKVSGLWFTYLMRLIFNYQLLFLPK